MVYSLSLIQRLKRNVKLLTCMLVQGPVGDVNVSIRTAAIAAGLARPREMTSFDFAEHIPFI